MDHLDYLQKFLKKPVLMVVKLLRPKWKGFGSLYFKFSSKLSTLLFDEIITDS